MSKKNYDRSIQSGRRLRFCRSKVNWSVENDWAKIIFSDEKKVQIGADKNKLCMEEEGGTTPP